MQKFKKTTVVFVASLFLTGCISPNNSNTLNTKNTQTAPIKNEKIKQEKKTIIKQSKKINKLVKKPTFDKISLNGKSEFAISREIDTAIKKLEVQHYRHIESDWEEAKKEKDVLNNENLQKFMKLKAKIDRDNNNSFMKEIEVTENINKLQVSHLKLYDIAKLREDLIKRKEIVKNEAKKNIR